MPVYQAIENNFMKTVQPEWFNQSGIAKEDRAQKSTTMTFNDHAELSCHAEGIWYAEYTGELFDYNWRERENVNPNIEPSMFPKLALSQSITDMASGVYFGFGYADGIALEHEQLTLLSLEDAKQTAEELFKKLGIQGYELAWALDMNLDRIHTLGEAYNHFWYEGGGYSNSPRQDYRLEWKLPRESLAKQVEICLRLEHLIPIVSRRGRNWVVSLKKAEEATEALSVIQAHLSRLNFEEIRALKETRNEVGRRVNAESANMARASLAAVRQIGCLRLLEREGVLSNLPGDLQRVARIRMDNPEAALRELTELFDPPLSKSTLNRRLKKLEDISREYGSPIFE